MTIARGFSYSALGMLNGVVIVANNPDQLLIVQLENYNNIDKNTGTNGHPTPMESIKNKLHTYFAILFING